MIPTLFDKMRANRKREIVWPIKPPPRGWWRGDFALHLGHPAEQKFVKVVDMVDAGWLVFMDGNTGPQEDYSHCDKYGNRMFMEESE